MWSLVILAALTQSGGLTPDDVQTFTANDRTLGSVGCEVRREEVDQNLGIMIRALRQAESREDAERIVAPFMQAARGNDDGFATSFSWADASIGKTESFLWIAVNYGAVGRVAVYSTAGRLQPLDARLDYMIQRQPSVFALGATRAIIASRFIRDAGVRERTRLDFVRYEGDRFLIVHRLDFEHTIEWGGAQMLEEMLVVDSLDAPKSFFVANAEALLKRRRIYRIQRGRPVLVKDQPGDLPLRTLDDWMTTARKAKKPNAMQQTLRKFLPEISMIDEHELIDKPDGSVGIVMRGASGEVRFLLRRNGSRFRVASATGKVR